MVIYYLVYLTICMNIWWMRVTFIWIKYTINYNGQRCKIDLIVRLLTEITFMKTACWLRKIRRIQGYWNVTLIWPFFYMRYHKSSLRLRCFAKFVVLAIMWGNELRLENARRSHFKKSFVRYGGLRMHSYFYHSRNTHFCPKIDIFVQ